MRALVRRGRTVRVYSWPSPSCKRADDVLIRVAAAGLNRSDVFVAEGLLESRDPIVMGYELAGVIEAIGPEVQGLTVGERVTVKPVLPPSRPGFSPTQLGVDRDGAFAELVCVPAKSVHRVPDTMSLRHATFVEPVAAAMAVLDARLDATATGVVLGSGRIGELTRRVCAAHGLDRLRCWDRRGAPLEPESLDFAIETWATEATLHALTTALRPGGLLVLRSRPVVPVALDVRAVVYKDLRIRGVSYGKFDDAIELLASGRLEVDDLIGEMVPLEDFERAFAHARDLRHPKVFFAIRPELFGATTASDGAGQAPGELAGARPGTW